MHACTPMPVANCCRCRMCRNLHFGSSLCTFSRAKVKLFLKNSSALCSAQEQKVRITYSRYLNFDCISPFDVKTVFPSTVSCCTQLFYIVIQELVVIHW